VKLDLTPLQGESLRGIDYPGLKPWTESYCPIGTNTAVATDVLTSPLLAPDS